MNILPKMPIKVGFDPTKSDEDRCADVWNIPAGRILMLLWRPGHLCSDSWYDEALEVARRIQKVRPQAADDLWRKCFLPSSLRFRSSDFPSNDCKAFIAHALDYFTGAKGVEYIGVVNGVSIMEPGKDRYI